jgi:hypothetical protein
MIELVGFVLGDLQVMQLQTQLKTQLSAEVNRQHAQHAVAEQTH